MLRFGIDRLLSSGRRLCHPSTAGNSCAYAQAKRRATANSAKEKQAALVAGGHASEDEEAPLVRTPKPAPRRSPRHEFEP